MTSTPATDDLTRPAARLEPDAIGLTQDTVTGMASSALALSLASPTPRLPSGRARAIGAHAAPSAFARLLLGGEVRRLREAASLRLEDVAGVLGVAPSTVSRIENGLAPTKASYLRVMLDVYGVSDPGCRRKLAGLADDGRCKGWWAEYGDVLPVGAGTYLGLESAASHVCSFSALAVPDLAQTEDYAAALFGAACPPLTADQADRLVTVTLCRQERARANAGQHAHLIIDAAVLVRPVGTARVMVGQLDRLAAMTDDPAVTIQVMPLRQARPVLTSSFTVLTFTEPGIPGVASRGDIHSSLDHRRDTDAAALGAAHAALAQAALPPAESARVISRLAARQSAPGDCAAEPDPVAAGGRG